MGEALDAMPKAKGGKQYHKSTGSNIEPVATLEQIGLSGSAGKHRSTRARKLKAHRVNAAGRTQVRVDDSVGPPQQRFHVARRWLPPPTARAWRRVRRAEGLA